MGEIERLHEVYEKYTDIYALGCNATWTYRYHSFEGESPEDEVGMFLRKTDSLSSCKPIQYYNQEEKHWIDHSREKLKSQMD
jgi:hypothetical protein